MLVRHYYHYYYYGFYVFPEDAFCSLAMWTLDGIPKGAHNQLACVEQTWLSVEVGLKNKLSKVEILFHSLPLGASHFWIAHSSMPAIKKPKTYMSAHTGLVLNGPFATSNVLIFELLLLPSV
jgi:hypothetical protein